MTDISPSDAWMPIETAPKDGTAFLAVVDGGYQVVAAFCPHYEEPEFVNDYTGEGFSPCFLTHWMHLPSPPLQEIEK